MITTADDGRLEIIAKAKEVLIRCTNIETSEDEMKVLDNLLFRCRQMGWLDRYEEKPSEKKHGRLIDADAYLKKICTYRETGCVSCKFQTVCPQDEPTINDFIDEIVGETE